MATGSLSLENRNEILAKLDAERQQRREHIVAGKTSPFRTSPVDEWEKSATSGDLQDSIPKTPNTNARELLVLKLLEERRKNAARLQLQLTQQSTLSQKGILDETNTETELGSDAERSEFENSNDLLDNSENFESSVNGSDERVFHSRSPKFSTTIVHDIEEEDLEEYNSRVSHHPPAQPLSQHPPSSSHPSSHPTARPPLPPQHPATRNQNLMFLKQQMQQKQVVPPSYEQLAQRQNDLENFDSAFQKIQENVYGRKGVNSEGYRVNGSWRSTIAFNQPPSSFVPPEPDEDFSQLTSLDQPPSTSFSLSRSSSTHSTHSMHSANSQSSLSHSSSLSYITPPSAPLSSFAPPLTSRPTSVRAPSPAPAQKRRAARPSSAPPRPASTTPPKKAPPRKAVPAQVSFSGISGRVSRHSAERVENDLDKEFQEKCPFEPNKEERGKKATMTKQKLELLAKNKRETIEKREEERRIQEQRELERLSFKPTVHPLPPEYGNHRPQEDVPLVERLYHEADKKVAMRAKAKNEMMKEQLRGCSFRPNISKPPSGDDPPPEVPQKPIYERLGEVQRQRREKLHRLKMQVEEEQKPTFVPYVNPLSRKMVEERNQSRAQVHSEGEEEEVESGSEDTKLTRSVNTIQPTKQKKRQSVDTFARLSDMEIEQEKKYKKQEKWQKLLADHYTFTPQVNANTEKILAQSDAFGNKIDFLDRLNFYKDKRKCAQMQAEPQRYTFQPYINPATKSMVEARQSRTGESEGDKYERLAFGDKEKRYQAKQHLEEEIYSKYTYKPAIDKISAIIAPQRTVDELYRDERKEENKRAAKKAAENAFKAEYTFQPQLYSNPYDHIEPKHKVDIRNSDAISQNIKQMEERKALKIQKEKLAQQQREMAQCTFAPNVNPSLPPSSTSQDATITVRGLDRYLELKDLAKKLEDNKKERIENAFKVKPSAVGGGGQPLHLPFTIPAPFHFHTRDRYAEEERQRKLEKINKEMRFNSERELTFQPRTNAKSRQVFSEEILSR
eukprot:Phypoly_transcript_01789.p1 GENE.Phypoly_transcript_01789~~Phypoly_transcript_01789.p1  ORF type:complete len:1014 (+),score=276.22 Phypoly_transcript_01789:85-3126(+)